MTSVWGEGGSKYYMCLKKKTFPADWQEETREERGGEAARAGLLSAG